MLTTHQIAQHIQNVEYRPGWTFTVLEDHIEGAQLRIRCDLEDSTNPGTIAELGIDTFLPPIPDTDYLDVFVLWRLKRIEIHESCEWFRVGGELVLDPHA